MGFPAPEAAALHACRVVKDNQLRDHIAEAMVHKHQQYQTQIRCRCTALWSGNDERGMRCPNNSTGRGLNLLDWKRDRDVKFS